MFSFLAQNADSLAYIHGYLLISLGVLVLLVGRVGAWSLPSKTLALCFFLFGLRVWTRVVRFNAELGPDGYGLTLFFTALAGLVLVDFVRRLGVFSDKRNRIVEAVGAVAVFLLVGSAIGIDVFHDEVRSVGLVLALIFVGLLWLRTKAAGSARLIRLFWLGISVYVGGYFFTPNTSVELNAHLSAEVRYDYAVSFFLQMALLLFPVLVLVWMLNRKFREIELQKHLTPVVSAGLAAWVFCALMASVGMATLFGNHAKTVSERNYGETLADIKLHIKNIAREGEVRLNLAAGSGLVALAVEKSETDRIAASKILDGMCQPKADLVCYIMNRSGETIATSNWDHEKSFLGNNFAFRNYFRNAMAFGKGEQVARGVTSAVPGFYSARRFDFPHKGQFVLVVKSNVLSFDERKDGREFVYAVDSDSNIILTNDRGAAGKRLFSDAQKSDGYLESVFTSGERLKFKGRNAVFYKEEAEVSGLRVAVVQIDDFHLFRLIGFGVGTLLLLSALLSALFVIFFFVSTQERVVEAERARKLEKENADTRAMLFHQDKLASLGFLSAGVAHEINNPLTVVTAVLTHIREVLSDAANFPHRESFLSLVDNATNASWRIANIVKRLLAFARTDKGELGPVSTHAVVQEAYEMVRYVLEKNSVELILQTHGDSPLIRANSGELGQVLLNLLTNAKDALSGTQNARIVLSVDENSESVFIRCSDNGPGVPETLRQKVFEPFFTTKEVGKGTGLGLAISSTLVASMGGRLRLETSETGGATFLLIFPKFNGAS